MLKGFFYLLITTFFLISVYFETNAQSCPANIDFETGTFSGWTCYTGYTSASGDKNLISLNATSGPVFNRHTINSTVGELDYYGGFPVLCPNGSGHSIRLGSTTAGGEAEGVSYEFTIPANENSYSLIYNYAVVFQSPNHRINEQPRMEIEITNVTDNEVISCASFAFIAVGSSLPGFQVSPKSDTLTVLYKDWSAVSVNLSGNAGKTIRLFFKTADCTFRRHFGYGYVDVNSDCSGKFTGATYCPDDTLVNLVAPYGYQTYTWFDSSLTNILGTKQTLQLSPPPPSGTTLAVRLDPYEGYGCPNTQITTLKDSLSIVADAGPDLVSCNKNPVRIGSVPKVGLLYKWAPAASLTNALIADPFAAPDKPTTYIVTTTNSGGGCRNTDTVLVRSSIIDSSLHLLGKPMFCMGYGDSAVLKVQLVKTIEWFKDNVTINGASQPLYRIAVPGIYYAVLTNEDGCQVATKKQLIVIENEKTGITYPVVHAIVNLPVTLNARPIGNTALWKPGINLNTATIFKPVYKGSLEQLYTIDIRTKAGCLTVDTQLVKIVKGVEIYVPTAFTPNNDGKNDFLHPVLRGVGELRYFKIFNRWGDMLYDAKTPQPGWDGIYKGVMQPTQSLVWMLQCIGLDGITYSQKGKCILLR